MASALILMDPEVTPDPQRFDPLRSYRQRLAPDQANLHQFVTTDKNHLEFGHGRYACSGRFFAAHEIKMILAHIILHYDLAYPTGKGRPINLIVDGSVYPDPSARLLIKKKG